MTKNAEIAILAILAMVAGIGLFASQTMARTSLSHYLCWIAIFISIGYAVFFLFQHFAKE